MFKPNFKFLLFALMVVAAGTMFGCGGGGSDGATGPAGPAGTTVVDAATSSPEALALLTPTTTIDSVTISSPPVVNFTITDSEGRGIIGIETFIESYDRYVRFTLAKLVPGSAATGDPGSGEPDTWVPYILSASSGSPSYDSPRIGGVLTGNGDGSYTYTFATDITAVDGVVYEPTLTHRLGGQTGGSDFGLEPTNMVYDFVPAGGAVTTTRDIAMTSSCNECHDPLNIHGRRREVGYCVTCHNPTIGDEDMAPLIHKIHTAQDVGTHEFTEVTYPQDVENCRKCHSGDDANTPDGDNWKNKPSIVACGACHSAGVDGVDFETGLNHGAGDIGGAQTDNSNCATCHPATFIEEVHLTPNATPNNPNLPEGVPEIEYELIEATVDDSNQAVITFRILRDGEALDLLNLDADMLAPGRWPDLYLGYALPQDGIDEPADYNNLGVSAGQRINVDIDQLGPTNNNDGTMVDNGDGTFTATTGGTTFPTGAFPAGATLRGVGLAGYFQVDTDGDNASDYSLHTPSAVIAVTGDDARREVVDSNKCANCHEWFEGHGGNRVFNMQICVFCHVPNLSSSGRTFDPADADIAADLAAADIDGVDPDDPLTWPEATNNLKDMIHGIHGGENRTTAYRFVRGGGHGGYYDWSEVTFPGRADNCLTCHKSGTYEVPLVDDTLMTTNRTTDGTDADAEAIGDARDDVPNLTDWVITPVAATCYACHDGELAVAHMEQNGASIDATRDSVLANGLETCATCHAPDRTADLYEVHELD